MSHYREMTQDEYFGLLFTLRTEFFIRKDHNTFALFQITNAHSGRAHKELHRKIVNYYMGCVRGAGSHQVANWAYIENIEKRVIAYLYKRSRPAKRVFNPNIFRGEKPITNGGFLSL